MGDFDSYGADPRRIEKAGDSFNGVKVDYASKYKSALAVVKNNYEALKVPYYGLDNDDYVNGLGFCCNPNPTTATTSPTGKSASNKNDNAELQQYYYHPDHLGSSSYITNLDGEVVQHVEYVPFGEVFLEEKNSNWNTPYLFNGKELDKETGLSYYGARYYDSKISVWLSVDPLAEKTMSPYGYCHNNPVNLTDPTGMSAEPPSTEVIKNKDGSHTVVGSKKDGDNNIYVVNNEKDKKRTGEIIGQTQNSWDFMQTNDETGKFEGYKKVTFSLSNLPNGNDLIDKYSTEFNILSTITQDSKISTVLLAGLSRNTGRYDVKSVFDKSTGGEYTAMSYNGKITTARTIGNILFGKNLRAINSNSLDQTLVPANEFYKTVMPAVGAYNQYQNNGNGYNSGFPFYGEHTYSGTGIYTGYFGSKPTKR